MFFVATPTFKNPAGCSQLLLESDDFLHLVSGMNASLSIKEDMVLHIFIDSCFSIYLHRATCSFLFDFGIATNSYIFINAVIILLKSCVSLFLL